jgi:AraC-like DNA-binding protein
MNHLILTSSFTLFLGTNPVPVKMHRHPSVQLVMGTSKPFRSKNKDGVWEEVRGLLIAPNHRHECDARDQEILSLDIDPESALGEWVDDRYLTDRPVIELPSPRLPLIDHSLFAKAIATGAYRQIVPLIHRYFGFDPDRQPSDRDQRVDQVLEYIREHLQEELSATELAGQVYLSESRLQHLFKSEMGLPMRNYIRWFRLQAGLRIVTAGGSLTEAAHEAGFFDQAHFTRTFTSMIGIPPSQITKNSRFVQVSIAE